MFFLTRPPLYLFTSYPMEGRGNLSNVLFQPRQFAPSHLCLWGGGGFQMFFLNSGSLHLLTSACGEGGDLNVPFKLGQFVPSHLCLWGRGGILNVPFKPRQIVSFHLCLRERGGGDLH